MAEFSELIPGINRAGIFNGIPREIPPKISGEVHDLDKFLKEFARIVTEISLAASSEKKIRGFLQKFVQVLFQEILQEFFQDFLQEILQRDSYMFSFNNGKQIT